MNIDFLSQSYDIDELQEIFEKNGYSIQTMRNNILRIETAGLRILISSNNDCISFISGFDKVLALYQLNNWNTEHLYTRAYLHTTMEGTNLTALQYDLNFSKVGVSSTQIIGTFELFVELCLVFQAAY